MLSVSKPFDFHNRTTDVRNLEEDIFVYAKKNLAVVNVYIKDPVVTRIMRDQKIPVIAFVANTGGLLGLCMGFSLVSLFEIFYHVLGAVAKWWKTLPKRQQQRRRLSQLHESETILPPKQQQQHQDEETSAKNVVEVIELNEAPNNGSVRSRCSCQMMTQRKNSKNFNSNHHQVEKISQNPLCDQKVRPVF